MNSNVNATPPRMPLQPVPQGGIAASSENPSTASLSSQFHTSPIAWNAHLLGATNSSQGVPKGAGDAALSPTNSSSATPAMPDWVRNLSEFGDFRGDECFRARFGNHASLLNNDGDLATRFTTDPIQCNPHLRIWAESLGAYMLIRNNVVAELLVAKAELEAAEAHLTAEENQIEKGQKAALQRPGPPGGVDFNALQQNVDTARAARKDAQTNCDSLMGVLQAATSALKTVHAQAEKQIGQSAPDLALVQEQAVNDILWEYLQSFTPENPLTAVLKMGVYAQFAGLSFVANALARSQDVHASDMVAPFLPSPDGLDDLQAAQAHRDLMCCILIGLVLAHLLIKTGILD